MPALQESAIDEVQRILDSADWDKYWARVDWAVFRPKCSFYEGGTICPSWMNWILEGRQLYDSNQQGRKEYVDRISKLIPSIPVRDITEIVAQSEKILNLL